MILGEASCGVAWSAASARVGGGEDVAGSRFRSVAADDALGGEAAEVGGEERVVVVGGGEAGEAPQDESGDGCAAAGAPKLRQRLRNHLGVGRVGAAGGGGGSGGRRRRR